MNAFPTSETVLRRKNAAPCGVMFCLFGPRAVRFTAIWEKDNNRVFFYGSNGKRYLQIGLPELNMESMELAESN